MNNRWFLVFMLFLAGAISYMDRAALSIAAPLIVHDLHLSPAQLGIVFSVFFLGYAPFCFVGGHAADRFGAKRVMVASMSVWSVFCGLTATVFSLPVLLVLRLIFGAAEGPYGTCTNKILSGWFERDKQTTAVGFANAGQQFGGAIAGPIVGMLMIAFGWRISFIGVALFGMLWVAVWAAFVRDRPKAELVAKTVSSAVVEPAKLSLGTYLRSPTVIATSLAFFGYAYILYFFLSWFPSYLVSARHLSLASMSFVNVIPWAFGAIGVGLGGWVSDLLFRWLKNPVLSRKVVIVVSLLVAAICVMVAGNTESVRVAVTLMAITVFFMNMTLSVYWGIILDTVEPARMGGVGGFMHFIANTAGVLAPAVTGFLVQWTGVYTSAFMLSGAVSLGGALAVAVFVDSRPIVSHRRQDTDHLAEAPMTSAKSS